MSQLLIDAVATINLRLFAWIVGEYMSVKSCSNIVWIKLMTFDSKKLIKFLIIYSIPLSDLILIILYGVVLEIYLINFTKISQTSDLIYYFIFLKLQYITQSYSVSFHLWLIEYKRSCCTRCFTLDFYVPHPLQVLRIIWLLNYLKRLFFFFFFLYFK